MFVRLRLLPFSLLSFFFFHSPLVFHSARNFYLFYVTCPSPSRSQDSVVLYRYLYVCMYVLYVYIDVSVCVCCLHNQVEQLERVESN